MFSVILKITHILDTEIIKASDKELKKRLVVGTAGEKQMAFVLWNDLTDHQGLKVGNDLNIDFRIESREYKNKYYTDLTITKIA